MSRKPPAFQFYAKDWNSSPTIARMSMADRGVFISLLSAAWDTDEPGTLPLPIAITARCARLDIRLVRNFLNKFPTCFEQLNGKLVNKKLHENWTNYQRISEIKRKSAEARYAAYAAQNGQSASASASAPKTITPIGDLQSPVRVSRRKPRPKPQNGHTNYTPEFMQFWNTYPKTAGKHAAFLAFQKVNPQNGDLEKIIESVKKHQGLEQWQRDDGKYIPHASTWLNQRRFEDEFTG